MALFADFTVTADAQVLHQEGARYPHAAPSPRIIICVRAARPQVERLRSANRRSAAGARQVYLIEGADGGGVRRGMRWPMPPDRVWSTSAGDHRGRRDFARGVVYANSVRVGGDRRDEAIISFIRRNYAADRRGPQRTDQEKMGSAFPGAEVLEMEVKGRSLSEGVAAQLQSASNEISRR